MSSTSTAPSSTSDAVPRLLSPAGDGVLAAEVYLAEREAETANRQRVEELWEEIAEVAAHIHAATYRLLVLVARALERLPLTSAAMECGELSYSKARALTRVATPETGAVVVRALEAAEQKLWEEAREAGEGEMETSPGQRRADALGLVAEGALGDGLEGVNRGDDRYQVVVHVAEAVLKDPEAEGQSLLDDGVSVSAETSRRLACGGSRVVMTRGPDGSTVSVGRKTRTIPPAIRRALEHRDSGCRFPG